MHYFKGEDVSEFLRDTMGYGATWQIGQNLILTYPTLGIGPGHVPQRLDIFPHGRDLAAFEPKSLRFQGFSEGRSDVSGFRQIHWASEPRIFSNNHNSKCSWWSFKLELNFTVYQCLSSCQV